MSQQNKDQKDQIPTKNRSQKGEHTEDDDVESSQGSRKSGSGHAGSSQSRGSGQGSGQSSHQGGGGANKHS